MFSIFAKQVVRSFKQGIPVKAAAKALNPSDKFVSPISKNSPAIQQQIQDMLKLGYHEKDLAVLNQKVVVDLEAMENRIYKEFKKASTPSAGQQQTAIAAKAPKTK